MNEFELSNLAVGAWCLPDEPTKYSLQQSKPIIIGYAEAGLPMPPKLVKHLSSLLDHKVLKPSRTVQKANRDRNKALDVMDVLILQYWCHMDRMGACEAIYQRDGIDEDPKTLYDNVSRKQYQVADIGELLEETFKTYGTNDAEEIKNIILTA